MTFSNGNHEEKDAIVNTDFIVYLTDRQKTSGSYLNTTSLIILNSHVKSEDTDSDVTSFKFLKNQL